MDTSTRRGHPAPTAIDARTDLHALGLLLHELATGIHAFDGEDFAEVVRQILDVSPRRCGSLVPQLSPFLEELISQLLEKDRERRPVSAEFVAAILDEGEKSRWWRERAAAIRRETRRPLRRIRIPRETSLHGRDAELTRLRELFDLAKAGDGRAVLVEGEAGIGKSRLVDEFVLSLWGAGEDFDFLFGSYPPGGAASASGAFVTAYREHLGDDEDALRDALPQTPALVPSFAALLRGDAPPAGAEKLTKDSIQALFVRATRSLAARRTTIVLIDDLHFAPEEGRALFTSLALAVPGHRILLLGGARRSVGEKWTTGFARLPNAARIALERLSPKDLVDLLADALRSPHLAEELGGRIAAKSDGNPFFVFEILRGLREGRFLTRRPDGTWITTRSIREIEVPPSIVEVIQARVLDLGVDERNVLEVASCIGFEFDAGLVGAVLRVEPIPLLQRLGRIEKAHRLVRSVGSGFAFDHHQVQEVLYAGLSPPLREAYHAAIGAAVELRSDCGPQHPRELDGALCVDLASHFLRGARGARALKYLDPALTHLEARWLNDAAFELCDLALAAPELLRGTARCEIALRKAARLTVLGRRDVARVALEAALALADATSEPGLRASARCWLGDHLSRVSCHDEAERVLLEAIAISEDTGDRSTLARVEERLGTAYSRWSRFDDAISHVERSLTLAREIGDLEIEALAAGTLGTAFWATGRWTEALTHHEAQLALAQELGDLRLEGYARGNVGTMLHLLGRVAESLDAFERSLSLAKETGDRILEGGATGRLTSEYIHLGRADDAIALARHHLGLAREIGDPREEARATASLGETAFRAGLLGEARARYRTSLELCRRTGWRHGEAGNLNRLVTIERELGSIEAARVHVEELLSLALAMGARSLEASALLARAELDADAGAVSAADRGFTEALVAFREIRSRGDEASTLGARGRHLALQGRVEEARADLESSLAIAREIGDGSATHLAAGWLASLPGSDASLSRFLLDDEARHVAVPVKLDVRFVLWRATGARSHLVDAKRLLDLMVANAPLDCRETMLTNVRLHREILAAWRGPSGDDGAPLRAA